jgi:hypothetical protein
MANAQESSEVANVSGKDLVNKDGTVTELIEWATESALTPEQMMDLFLESDIPVSHGEEITGDYVVIHADEKARWCTQHVGQRLMVVQWHFYDGTDDNEFAAMHIISNAGKFIVNDSAKGGMYGQLRTTTDRRERLDPRAASRRTSTAGLMVVRGLRQNKTFLYNSDTKKSIPKSELEDLKKHPMDKRKESKLTWSFDI